MGILDEKLNIILCVGGDKDWRRCEKRLDAEFPRLTKV